VLRPPTGGNPRRAETSGGAPRGSWVQERRAEQAFSPGIPDYKKAKQGSGITEPSPEDLEFTRGVQKAGELMGIELYDHVIVARSTYTSLREMGML